MNWEYMHLTEGTQALDSWAMRLNALGSLGWEVVAITHADRTIGINSMTAMLKRQAPSIPAPPTTAAGWYPDTSGRFAMRYWDGLRWTEHVQGAEGGAKTDYPNVRAA